MEKLIKAFTIFKKYSDSEYPTCCEHDILYVNVDPNDVSKEDVAELEELGFTADFEDLHNFYSFRFGS